MISVDGRNPKQPPGMQKIWKSWDKLPTVSTGEFTGFQPSTVGWHRCFVSFRMTVKHVDPFWTHREAWNDYSFSSFVKDVSVVLRSDWFAGRAFMVTLKLIRQENSIVWADFSCFFFGGEFWQQQCRHFCGRREGKNSVQPWVVPQFHSRMFVWFCLFSRQGWFKFKQLSIHILKLTCYPP